MRLVSVIAVVVVLAVAWLAGYALAPSPAPSTSAISPNLVEEYVFTAASNQSLPSLANSTPQQRIETEYVTQTLTTSATGIATITTICTTPGYTTTTTTLTITSFNNTQTASTKTVTKYETTTHFDQTVTSWECQGNTSTVTTTTYVTTTG